MHNRDLSGLDVAALDGNRRLKRIDHSVRYLPSSKHEYTLLGSGRAELDRIGKRRHPSFCQHHLGKAAAVSDQRMCMRPRGSLDVRVLAKYNGACLGHVNLTLRTCCGCASELEACIAGSTHEHTLATLCMLVKHATGK
jgi:hypothetical protein